MKVHFMLNKGGTYSGAIDNAMSIICMDLKGENIPDIRSKTNPSPLFLSGRRKRISIRVVDWLIESETKCGRNIGCLPEKMLMRGHITNTTICSGIEDVHYIHKT